MIVAVAALLLFGKRLPEVASQAGATLAKFRRGLDGAIHDSGVEQEIRKIKSALPTDMSVRDVARAAARKFEDRLREGIETEEQAAAGATAALPAASPASSPASSSASSSAATPAVPSASAELPPTVPPPHVVLSRPGVDPASQFQKHAGTPSENGAHSASSPSETAPLDAPRSESLPPARVVPPGSVPRE
jgi:Sec-independent protein translocase protein TatA